MVSDKAVYHATSPDALETRDLNVAYGTSRAVMDVSLKIPERSIVSLIGARTGDTLVSFMGPSSRQTANHGDLHQPRPRAADGDILPPWA